MFCASTFIVTFALLYGSVTSDSMEQYKAQLVNQTVECAKRYPLTAEDLDMMTKKQTPERLPAKCFLACYYSVGGVTEDGGNLSSEKVLALGEKYLSDNPSKLEKLKEFVEICQAVNDVELGGENVECERAALIFKCSVEEAPEIDLV